MGQPKVIICMSTFNGEKFLAKQINSIKQQDYKNWNLFIHDDGSKDRTREIIDGFIKKDGRIFLIDNRSEHLGVKRAFLTLSFREDAEFYMFSDQDDIWQPNKISYLLNVVQKKSQEIPLLIHSDYQNMDKDDKTFENYFNSDEQYSSSSFNDLVLKNNVTGCTCLFNKALRDRVKQAQDVLDYTKMIMHDWWLALVASSFGKVLYTHEKTVLYRQHDNNVAGAPGRDRGGYPKKILNFFLNRNYIYINQVCKQAELLLDVYGNGLSDKNRKICLFLSGLQREWRPIQQIMFARANSLKLPSRLNSIQFYLFILSPKLIRRKFV